MAFARTLRGDVAPATSGAVNAHDHLIRVGRGEVHLDRDHQLDSVEKAVEEAGYFVAAAKQWSAAGGTVVDMCPINTHASAGTCSLERAALIGNAAMFFAFRKGSRDV